MTNEIAACLGCEGRCCTVYIVPLTGFDVWRMVQGLQLAAALFVQREPEDSPTDTSFLLRPFGPAYGLALQHHPPRRNERRCVFLLQLREGVQRCGIYGNRPRACRTYPMRWYGRELAPREDLLCPDGSWYGLARDDAPWRAQMQHQDREWSQYERVVQAWNSVMRTQAIDREFVLDQYLEYLINVYDALAALQQADGAGQLHGDTEYELAAFAEAYMNTQ